MADYRIASYPMQTTAGPLLQTLTAATIKTILQVQTPATRRLEVVGWGFSFNGTAANVPVVAELVDTAAIAATVTAHSATGVQPWSDPGAQASLMTLGVAATGYNSSGEGAIVATRTLDAPQYPPTQPYAMWFPLGDRPKMAVSRNLRIRMLAAVTITTGVEGWVVINEIP